MTQSRTKPSVLLIDDNEVLLDGLRSRLEEHLQSDDVDIRVWRPTAEDEDTAVRFGSFVDDETVLVATDYDLTSGGMRGLFGTTIVGWCQTRLIPVGDFSRANRTALPREPDLFELRVPSTDIEAAQFIASAFRGFHTIREKFRAELDVPDLKRGLAAVLATLLKRPHLESQFSLYMTRLGAANSALVQRLRDFAGPPTPNDDERVQVLSYVLGHVLFNAILRFPGPILSEMALCAYMSTSGSELEALTSLFAKAAYSGPFGDNARYYWREDVDAILDEFGSDLNGREFEMFGDFNRAAVERELNRPIARHDCARCGGDRGGFLCPFTQRPVCLRVDCSVSSSGWIPQGAQLSRVERDFYDEWAPLLGL